MKKIKLKKKDKNVVKEPKEKKVLWKTILSWLLLIGIFLTTILLVFALYIIITSPDFKEEELYQTEPTILYDKYGVEFARVGSEDSTVVSYEDIPEVLIDSLIATEDSRFFQHNGLDLYRFVVATGKTLLGSDDAGGASTLSMQVIKNTYTQKGRLEKKKLESLVRKFRDIYMSVFKLEANYTKEEIIEFYLNSQWFANSKNVNTSGMYGVERASQYYFGKSVKDINLAEASLMAGMFQNPRLYNPYKNPEGCRNRQNIVLRLLVRHGYITEEEKDAVLAIPVSSMLTTQDQTGNQLTVESNQAFVDYVVSEVTEDLGINPKQESLKIYTTFDPKVQDVLESVEKGEVYKYPDDMMQEGIAVTSTKDGSVIALSGGRNYSAMALNRAHEIERQPGSTAKPIMDYAMYIEYISKSSYAMFLDEPTTYSNGTKITNYDNSYKHLITMRYALSDSRNIPALLAFKAVYKKDPKIIQDFAHSVGVDYGEDLVEAMAIGGFSKGVSPLTMSAAYASFGRGGYYIEPYGYTKVINNKDGKEYTHSYTKNKVMEDSTAWMINSILLDTYHGSQPGGTDVAGKTGTTNLDKTTKTAYKLPGGAVMDAWMITYSPSYSIALWVGYDKILKESSENKWYLTSNIGGNARRTIMNTLSKKIHTKNESFKRPKTVSHIAVEKESFPAQLCSSNTPKDMCISEYFVRGTEPTEKSKRYATLDTPTNGSSEVVGNNVTLRWDGIATPEPINPSYLQEHFKKYYDKHAESYYQKRISYNNNYIGNLIYEVYLKTSAGETKVGTTSGTSYVYTLPANGSYTFIIKASYSIFTAARSSGLTINVTGGITPPVVPNTDTNTDTDAGI